MKEKLGQKIVIQRSPNPVNPKKQNKNEVTHQKKDDEKIKPDI
jgi:hypothetical protein